MGLMAKHYTVRPPDVSLTSYDIWIPYSVIGNSLVKVTVESINSRQHELLDSEDQPPPVHQPGQRIS